MKLYTLITYKRKLEEWLMHPFVQVGKRWAARHPLSKEYDVFFFFPIYGLGGAEKVNADIAHCVADKEAIIFFTRISHDNTSFHLFKGIHVTIYDISKYTDNKWRYWANLFYRGVCAFYINQQKKIPVVFNGQCNFAYKLFPHLKKDVRKIELSHNSFKHFSWITFPYIPFIDQRVMIADSLIQNHAHYYDEIGLNPAYKARIRKIVNKIEVPENAGPRTEYSGVLKCYYAGRGGPQKRIHLLVQVIEQCLKINLPVAFYLAGNFKDELSTSLLQKVTYYDELKGGKDMTVFHQRMDVLMMTSAFEGFPMVIMEAMINGVVPVATAVNGIPEHIKDGYNGLLIYNAQDEKAVVHQLVKHLIFLCNHQEKLKELSAHAYAYAYENFNGEKFCQQYREVMGF